MGSTSTTSDVTLSKGKIIGDKWRVISQLGKGGFGTVYKVVSAMGNKNVELAMKIEAYTDPDVKESMIMMEIAVLKMFRNQTIKPLHACKYYDCGQTSTVRYVVMEMLGNNLGELRRARDELKFTESTSVRLGIQCLAAIESVHRIGFVHRDIKPANFAMGKGSKSRIVIIIDFGLARQIITREGQLREPRKYAGFRGTVRYASPNAHSRKELGRHDDLWCILYVMIEFHRGELPWSKLSDKNEVGKIKKEIVLDELLKNMAKEFHNIANELYGMQYCDVPKYAYFEQQFKAILMRMKYRNEDPFDWETQ